MKPKLVMSCTAMVLFAALTIPDGYAAQDQRTAKHHHYRLIDMGTFGGPASFVNETIPFVNGNGDINARGSVTGGAATSDSTSGTSNPLVCGGFGGIPFVFHAFRWQSNVVTDLGTLAGTGLCSAAGDVNAHGDIVGQSEIGVVDPLTGFNETHPVRWKDGQITDLGNFGGNQGGAGGINTHDQIVGFSLNTTADPYSIFDLLLGSSNGTQTRAALWQNGQMRDLGTLGGPDAIAWLVNESGQIVGSSYTNYTQSLACPGFLTTDPFLWNGGKMTNLGTLGGTCGFPSALNNRGEVVGDSSVAGDASMHAFLWDRGVLTDLGTLGGSFSAANAISDSGEIAGYATNARDQAVFAVLWTQGQMTDLGTLDGDPCSSANSINSREQVVGLSATCDFATRRAFLWEHGSMVDLNTLVPPNSGLQLTIAEAINDHGEIAGNGTPTGCNVFEQCGHAFLLIPCDANHPGIAGCDYSMVDANVAAPRTHPAERSEASRISPPSLIRLMMSRLRLFGAPLGQMN